MFQKIEVLVKEFVALHLHNSDQSKLYWGEFGVRGSLQTHLKRRD